MTEHRIIRADFASFRHIQGRKILQLVMEVPIEEAEDAFEKLGFPKAGETKWCAIALLAKNGSVNESDVGPHRNAPKLSESTEAPDGHHGSSQALTPASIADGGTSETREKRAFSALPLSQQAAMRCNEPLFQEYVKREDAEGAADEVRLYCEVESRSEIKLRELSGARWLQLDAKYRAWLTDRQFAEARR